MKKFNKNLTKQTLLEYYRAGKKYSWLFVVTVIAVILATLAEIYKPYIYKLFFDHLTKEQPSPERLINLVFQAFVLGLLSWFFWRVATFIAAYFQARVMRDLQQLSFEVLHKHSINFFNNNFAGSLVRKINKFSKAYETITDQFFWSFIPVFVRIVTITVILSFRSKMLGLYIVLWSIVYIAFNYWFSVYKLKYDIKRTELDSQVTGVIADTIANNVNLKLFTGYKKEALAFSAVLEKWYKATNISWNLGNFNEAIQGMLMVLLELLVFYYAIIFWQQGKVSVGDFAMIQVFLMQIFNKLWELGRNIRRVYESFADANEMTEIINTPLEVSDKLDAKSLSVSKGKISFKNVGFYYNKENPVFKNFNLDIEPKERIALIGPSGGGKSTVTKLLFRFMDIQSGEILIDGQNIANTTQDSLRENISLVPQEPILFHRTLIENIRYGNPKATDEEVFLASKKAHAHEFINSFPLGYETYVGERGVKLSGGQRQRIAIARAILKNAPILVLDEATSSLDSESEHYIQEALKELIKNKTVIVIAHRLSTVMQMDRIIVLEDGKIKEQGKHEELLKLEQGTYQKLWQIQAGSFSN